jgi:DNA-binding transcriptional MocR family regulator
VAETLETGELQRFVYDKLQVTYCKRYRKIIEVINKDLVPLGVRLPQTDRNVVGGYFIWLTLPDSVDGAALAQRAKDEENVVVAQVSTKRATASGSRSQGRLTDSVHRAIFLK